MKVCLITLFTPTSENRKGPSALNYYLMRDRDRSIDITVFSFNINSISKEEIGEIEKSLHVRIAILPLPRWYKFITSPRHKMTFIRVFLSYPLLSYIKVSNRTGELIKAEAPDLLWWYPNELYTVPRSLSGYKHILTGPDCASLTYFRALQVPVIYNSPFNLTGYMKILLSTLNMERKYETHNMLMHVVGQGDLEKLREINPRVNAFFLLHPHYALSPNPKTDFNKKKLKILMAGANFKFNVDETTNLVRVLCEYQDKLSSKFTITFLGKGWEKETGILKNAGYECSLVEWVEDYIESIVEYDIQITMMSAGAGTKGKVLDALANGLLVIGSEIAFENIAVRHLDSCLRYRKVEEIPVMLQSIAYSPQRYEAIAQKGMRQVRTYHSPYRISERFFNIADKFLNK